jgi:hypothetical protein
VLFRSGWTGLGDRDTVTEAVDMLAVHGWLTETPLVTGGRPTTLYSLAPGADRG